jgi:hypothetical protein
MFPRAVLAIAWTLASLACTSYEYEEEIFLGVDGSGSLRVSGSTAILDALHVDPATISSMTSRFRGPGLVLDSVRATEREGRRFIHVQGRFTAWNELCTNPAFADRECELQVSDDELALHLTLPAPSREAPEDVPPDARLALRFHFPSSVRFHNSERDIERGNIIGWERTVSEHFGSPDLVPDLVVEARFEKRSVLASTLMVLGTATGIVIASVGLALWLMVRKGRRQLASEAAAAQTPTPRRR